MGSGGHELKIRIPASDGKPARWSSVSKQGGPPGPDGQLRLYTFDGWARHVDGWTPGAEPLLLRMRDRTWSIALWMTTQGQVVIAPDEFVHLFGYRETWSDDYNSGYFFGDTQNPPGYALRPASTGVLSLDDFDLQGPQRAHHGYFLTGEVWSEEEWAREIPPDDPFHRPTGRQHRVSQFRLDGHSTLRVVGLPLLASELAPQLRGQGLQITGVRVRFQVQQGFSAFFEGDGGYGGAVPGAEPSQWSLYAHRWPHLPAVNTTAPPSTGQVIHTFGRPPAGLTGTLRGEEFIFPLDSLDLTNDIAFSLYGSWGQALGSYIRVPLKVPTDEITGEAGAGPDLPELADGYYSYMAQEVIVIKVTVLVDTGALH